mmetsp:Transcript_50887/g.108055  ORF Transcript_50887/g.108055 Transcript_50887/m.108055 type:complete len:97 (-) Transcript_50887:21-311(-)
MSETVEKYYWPDCLERPPAAKKLGKIKNSGGQHTLTVLENKDQYNNVERHTAKTYAMHTNNHPIQRSCMLTAGMLLSGVEKWRSTADHSMRLWHGK